MQTKQWLKRYTLGVRILVLVGWLFILCRGLSACQAQASSEINTNEEQISSKQLIDQAWAAHGNKDEQTALRYTQEVIERYQEMADRQQASLKEMPKNKNEILEVEALNDVATAYFIQGEIYRYLGERQKAIHAFKTVVERYPFAQAWDQRGWFWSVAKAAQESIDKLEGRTPTPPSVSVKVSQKPTTITLYDPGKEEVVNYEKYGRFENVGTANYRYVILDQEGLSLAVGEGIYPNTSSVRWDPAYRRIQQEKRLEGSHWDFLASPDLEAAFFKWATCNEPSGVKLFYTAFILEKAGLIKHAIKCYYAVVVHFPHTYSWTYWHTPWYVGPEAINRINFLLKKNPQLGYSLEGAQITVVNGFDNDVSNDIFVVNPGRFVKTKSVKSANKTLPSTSSLIKAKRGEGKVHLVQYQDGGWQLMVEGKPYIIKGITYMPTKVGQSPDEGTLGNWMEEDFNGNGMPDSPFDSFVDKNRNNLQDPDELAVGDFQLMKEMGVNTIRLYHQPFEPNKDILRRLYQEYGIRVIMGDFLGKYTFGSGAPWNPGTDYRNPEHRKNMLESVLKMVREHKDEPYILFWLLGNENVYGYACNADKEPVAFFSFANEVAQRIKEIDPQHPVAICNGDVLYLNIYSQYCPDIDIFGANAYRGPYGFGPFWQQVKELTDRPAFITEFGCPAYADGKSQEEAEQLQAEYHSSAWENIRENSYGQTVYGNAVGGIVFEWVDEWWKAYEPAEHDTHGLWKGPFPDGQMHEEWLGVCSQGDGKLSPFLRQLRPAYFMYKKAWQED